MFFFFFCLEIQMDFFIFVFFVVSHFTRLREPFVHTGGMRDNFYFV